MIYKNTVIMGDFNFPEINCETWTVNKSETHPAFHFVEGIRDNFLCQHIDSFTGLREGQDPSCLDLLFTDKEEIIDNIKIGDKLGASDHVSIVLMNCVILKEMNTNNKGLIFIRQTTDQFAHIYKTLSGMKCQTWTQRILGISL